MTHQNVNEEVGLLIRLKKRQIDNQINRVENPEVAIKD